MPASHARPHLPGLFLRPALAIDEWGGDQSSYKENMGSSYSPGIGIPSCQYQERQTFLLFYLYCFRLYLFCTIPPLSISSSSSSYQRKIPGLSFSVTLRRRRSGNIYHPARATHHTQRRLVSFILYLSASISILQTFIFYFILFYFCSSFRLWV
jgi:hypothetical protein